VGRPRRSDCLACAIARTRVSHEDRPHAEPRDGAYRLASPHVDVERDDLSAPRALRGDGLVHDRSSRWRVRPTRPGTTSAKSPSESVHRSPASTRLVPEPPPGTHDPVDAGLPRPRSPRARRSARRTRPRRTRRGRGAREEERHARIDDATAVRPPIEALSLSLQVVGSSACEPRSRLRRSRAHAPRDLAALDVEPPMLRPRVARALVSPSVPRQGDRIGPRS
jgi:hypothetical protein